MTKVRVHTKETLGKILQKEIEIPYDFSSRERTLIEYCQDTETNISELSDDFDQETYTLIFYRLCFSLGRELLKKDDEERAQILLGKIQKS